MIIVSNRYFIAFCSSYFSAVRNGFPPPTDPRFKPSPFPNLISSVNTPINKDGEGKKSEFPVLHPFAGAAMFPPLIDMSTTQTLLAMVRTAKESELQVSTQNSSFTIFDMITS